MNPYEHESIINAYDKRLVDCFVKQNQQNAWLSVVDVARWVFRTNKPNPYQKEYCQRKLLTIKGMSWTSEVARSFLEQGKNPSREYLYVYRLKDASLIEEEDKASVTVEDAINSAYGLNPSQSC